MKESKSTAAYVTPDSGGLGQWALRFVKGMVIISGAVLPGISGGVLAVVLGIYEPLMRVLGDLRRNLTRRNILFLLPVALGMGVGLLVFAVLLSALLERWGSYVLWFFIGGIVGTLPSLYKTAGEQGRKSWHWLVMVAFGVATLVGLMLLQNGGGTQLPTDSAGVWGFAGALMGLGTVIPGLSPSNFILFLGLLEPLMNGIKDLQPVVLLPFFAGYVLIVLALARLMNFLFDRAHSVMYHAILGIVLGSTLVIIPGGYPAALICTGVFLAGLAGSLWMADNEHRKEGKG